MVKKERNAYRDLHSEDELLNKLTEIEQTYDMLYEKFLKDCPDKDTIDKIKSIIGNVYSMIAFYYLPNEKEISKKVNNEHLIVKACSYTKLL